MMPTEPSYAVKARSLPNLSLQPWPVVASLIPAQSLLDARSPSKDAQAFFRAHDVGQAPEKRQQYTDGSFLLHTALGITEGFPEVAAPLLTALTPGQVCWLPILHIGRLVCKSPCPSKAVQHPPPGPREPTTRLVPSSTSEESRLILRQPLLRRLLFPDAPGPALASPADLVWPWWMPRLPGSG